MQINTTWKPLRARRVIWTISPPKTLMKLKYWRQLSVKLDSQANQRNQTEVLPATTTLQLKAASSKQRNVPRNKYAKKSNREPPIVRARTSLLKYVTCDRAIAFWTSLCVPRVACEGKYFFTTGRWGTSPRRGPPGLPCRQREKIVEAIREYCRIRGKWAQCLEPKRIIRFYLPCFGIDVNLFFFKFLRHLCRANNNIHTRMTLCFPLFSLKGKDILEHAILGWTSCHLSRVSPFLDLICNIQLPFSL